MQDKDVFRYFAYRCIRILPCDSNGAATLRSQINPIPELEFRMRTMCTPNSSLLKRLSVYHWSGLPQLAGLALLYALLAKVSLTYFLGNSVVAIV